jgi:hypothetical protein
MTKSITFSIDVRRTLGSAGMARLVISVSDVVDENGDYLPEAFKRIFLVSKPEALTAEVSVEDCNFIGYAPVERFNEIHKRDYGDAEPADWDSLPYSTPVIAPDGEIEDATVPSDTSLGSFVEDRIITSSVRVVEGSFATLATIQEELLEAVANLKDKYGEYSNDFSTVVDLSLYPTGWEVFEV